MAFSVDAIVDGTTTSLTDGSPFKLLSARGMSGPPIRRVTARGPAQHGDTDLGYRLQPREMELAIGFRADTDAALDGYRDLLHRVFRPLTDTPVQLRVTRDDGAVRQIDCHTVGQIKIDLLPEYRPGHYHRAVVRLLAPDPTYYDPVPGTVSVQGTPTASFPYGVSADWYLAGGAIGTARVLMHGTAPAQNETWNLPGTLAGTSSWTLAFAAVKEPATGSNKYAFTIKDSFGFTGAGLYTSGESFFAAGGHAGEFTTLGPNFMPAGTANYFWRYDGSAGFFGGNRNAIQRGTLTPSVFGPSQYDLGSATWRWYRDPGTVPWQSEIPLYALYSPGLTDTEIATLDQFMPHELSGTLTVGTALQLNGDMPDYPIIRITGPIVEPYVYHVYSGKTLSFSGSISAGATWIIDTRYGYKTVLEGTINRRSFLKPESDLAEWHLSPDTVQGINSFVLGGQFTSAATKLEIVYYHRYSSY